MDEELNIPLWNRYLLTINEASVYFNIGRHHLRQIVSDHPENDFVLYDGRRVLIKRVAFERFIDETESV